MNERTKDNIASILNIVFAIGEFIIDWIEWIAIAAIIGAAWWCINWMNNDINTARAERDAKLAVATPLTNQYIKDNCPRTRLGGAHNTTVFICNNGDNEYTYDQLIAKFSPK
jgi:hypothetical protein